MKKFARVLLTLVCVLLFAAAAGAETIKLGFNIPMTGDIPKVGEMAKYSAEMLKEQINAAGGLEVGGKKYTLEFVYVDNETKPESAVNAALKLIEGEKVLAMVGPMGSGRAIPAGEVANNQKTVMVAPWSTNPKTTLDRPYVFRACFLDDFQGPVAAKFATEQLKAKTVYIVDDKTTYSQGLADNVEKMAADGGLKVLGHEHVNQGDKDYSAILTKVKAAKPDVFYVSLQNSASAAPMLIQVARMGIKTKILAQDAVYHPQLMELAKKDAEGVFLTFGYTDKETPAYKQFADAYKKFGEPGAYSAYAYDSTLAYLKAVKAAGGTDPEKVKAELMKLEFEGASKKIKYKENGDSGSNYVIQVVKDGKFTNYWNPETGQLF